MQSLLYENELDSLENQHEGGTHFDLNGFARRVVLIPRQVGDSMFRVNQNIGRKLLDLGFLNFQKTVFINGNQLYKY